MKKIKLFLLSLLYLFALTNAIYAKSDSKNTEPFPENLKNYDFIFEVQNLASCEVTVKPSITHREEGFLVQHSPVVIPAGEKKLFYYNTAEIEKRFADRDLSTIYFITEYSFDGGFKYSSGPSVKNIKNKIAIVSLAEENSSMYNGYLLKPNNDNYNFSWTFKNNSSKDYYVSNMFFSGDQLWGLSEGYKLKPDEQITLRYNAEEICELGDNLSIQAIFQTGDKKVLRSLSRYDMLERLRKNIVSTIYENGECSAELGEFDYNVKISLKEKDLIYNVLQEKYLGFADMQKAGFTKKKMAAVKTYGDLKKLLDQCINDYHFSMILDKEYNPAGSFSYRMEQTFDEGTTKSIDPDYTFKIIETSNAYYIRCNSCDKEWNTYLNLPAYAEYAKEKDYIIMDFRSNGGGNSDPQDKFYENLVNMGYKGTIYILQDNWSYSAGESWIWSIWYRDYLNMKLVGTHSGGMQRYGDMVDTYVDGHFFYLPSIKTFFKLPENYLGEGKGYEPQIWATTEQMYSVLSNLEKDNPIDLGDIVFQ